MKQESFSSSAQEQHAPSLGAQLMHDYLLKKKLASVDSGDEALSRDVHEALVRLVDRVRSQYVTYNPRKPLKELPSSENIVDLLRPELQKIMQSEPGQKLTQDQYEQLYARLEEEATNKIERLTKKTVNKKAA
jgi:hypothetical protein